MDFASFVCGMIFATVVYGGIVAFIIAFGPIYKD